MVAEWGEDGAEGGNPFSTVIGPAERLQPSPAAVRTLYHLNLWSLLVNALVLAGSLLTLGYVAWKCGKRRHNLLALHNLRSIVLLAALLVALGEIGHQWLTVGRLELVRTGSTDPARPDPEAHSAQSEAFGTTMATTSNRSIGGAVDADADAVGWKMATFGLGAAWFGLLAPVGLAMLVRAIERRDKCGLLYIALASEGAQSIVRWCKFKYINDVTDTVTGPTAGSSILGSPEVFLTLAGALTATTLATIDGFTLYLEQNSGRRHVSSIMSGEKRPGFKTPHSPFLSKITFHWIVPLLWRGYREPLELESLGSLHEKDTSRYHYDQFLFIYQSYKSVRASLWRCYVRNGWRMFLVGGFLKLTGDLCALVGPLCISNIVDYIAATQGRFPSVASLILGNETASREGRQTTTLGDGLGKSNQSPGTQTVGLESNVGPITWSTLLANGWIVAVLVLVASLAQGTLSQASTHLMDAEGIRLKNALQGLVYRKTLLLSSSCFHSVQERRGTLVVGGRPHQSNKPRTKSLDEGGWHGGGEEQAGKESRRTVNNRAATVADAERIQADAEVMHHKTLPSDKMAAQAEGGGSGNGGSRSDASIDVNRVQQFADGSEAHTSAGHKTSPESETEENSVRDVPESATPASEQRPGNAPSRDATEPSGGTSTGGQEPARTFAHDAGTITNLMSDDAFNVMSFVKMVHYVWAIPLKIAVVMYLLYRQLGISTVIGSVVCIVTMTPLQILIGKLMAANSKKASECTDERLRRINEVLLGIKLIKLNAWEGVFKDKISQARHQELRHLDLDSIYWTLMMLLTHISSVLITIVTIAVFLALENNPIELTAGRLFASLALFNQLTVPLFIFPITIPVTLSAIVSTGRLEAFLGQPEVERGSLEGIRTMARILSKSDASLDMYEAGDSTDGGSEADPLHKPVDRLTNGQESAKTNDNVTVTGAPVCEADREPADTAPLSGERRCTASQQSSVSSGRSEKGTQPERDRAGGGGRPKKFQKSTGPNPRVKLKKNSQLSVSARLEKCRQKQKHLAREMRFGLPDDVAVLLKDARFRWVGGGGRMAEPTGGTTDPAIYTLYIEQLTIPKAKLTVIVGRSGSGKSSLLAALLKEINHLSGELLWNKYSSIAYVPQKPWLQNATIRENVLFGESFRPKRYDRVLRACALKPDLDLMPAGDGTEIGERGLKLSGGQRQRIAIARALYSSANVVILDDPLSALDNEVATYVFEHGIDRMLSRQKRTIILVTQRVQLVHRADNIVAMEQGAVSATGSLTEIENNYPHILREWNAIIAKEQQRQSSEAQSSPGRTARERWKLFKNISRIGFQRSHAAEENDFMERTFYLSRTLANRGTLFGSRLAAHDFPLPIEDCHEPNVALRRHFSSRLRKDSPPATALAIQREPLAVIGNAVAQGHQSVFRTFSLQTGVGTGSGGTQEATGSEPNAAQRQPAVVVRHVSFPTALTAFSAVRPFRTSNTGNDGNQFRAGQLVSSVSGLRRIEDRAIPDEQQPEGSETAEMDTGDQRRSETGANSNDELKRSSIGFRIPEFLRRMSFRGRRFSNPTEFGRPYAERNATRGSCTRKTSSLKSIPKERHRSIRRLLSTISRHSQDTEESSVDGEGEVSNRLLYDDERKYGRIPTRLYWLYLKSCGPKMVAIFFLSALAQQALKVYTDFWLQEWTDQTSATVATARLVRARANVQEPFDIEQHFHIYVTLSAVCIVLAAISVPAGQRAGSNARRRLHRELIASVLQNSIHFFQSVPLGRIMNRLSVDIAVVDKKIAATSQKLLQFILLCLCAVLINSVVTPYFILLTIPICGIYYVVQKFYRASSRELQRIESITYSPILAHFSETIEGVTTIRAFGQEARFMEVLFRRMEANNVAQIALNCSNRWLGIALDYLGAAIVFVAILTALITASLRPHSTSSSLIGLAINYAMLVPIYLNWVVKLFAEMEMYGGAVERIQSFIETDERRGPGRLRAADDFPRRHRPFSRGTSVGPGGAQSCSYKSVPISWPLKGDIVFENVSLRYENQKENIIANLNLTIPAGQRLGICGRTGSGKSSLALALFGALEVTGGRILIDDVDIAGLHTDELRSRLSIIPQEVMLFGGSVRENLDPRGHFSDLELWNCLELAQLKSIVHALPNGLDTKISDDKHYFSSGQRQLFCLARAILRGSVCLVLDEATSSLDTDTEKLVLQAAKKAFKGRTVITIAHRLHSLFDYDRVLVLEQGRIVEDGCPRQLAGTAGSKFGAMLKANDHQQHSILEDDG
ncbi:ATP-binding cassette sub-family C member Sur [Anopheles ziemanni]|uniref:ATP-binding cassette sub-family C member Sur n=1 Tax=Anopheles coustani TaxID=139045 RepID=UPI00265B1DD9|nr:ATP-binding cassette sub-family C member Sur [Anopheles coustani]XP_058177366.1 ATP-binding cassette sub-family C member Sur [Anopheles ziemanni]